VILVAFTGGGLTKHARPVLLTAAVVQAVGLVAGVIGLARANPGRLRAAGESARPAVPPFRRIMERSGALCPGGRDGGGRRPASLVVPPGTG
jgi:hypothetical protein